MHELIPPTSSSLSSPAQAFDAARLVESFFQNRSAGTLKAYRQDLESFATFVGAPSLEAAAALLLGKGAGPANHLALSFKNHLRERKLAPASINRKLAALRSLVKLGRVIGLISFSLEVEGLEVETLRDTRGPGPLGVQKLLQEVERRGDQKGKRDYAMLRLLYDLALRRAELCSLDQEHVDLEQSTLSVLGKGRHQRQLLTLPDETRDALRAWLKVRGEKEGPLFVALDPRAYGQRLSGEGVYQVVGKIGQKAGLRARPHGLRHCAITEALNETGGNLRLVQKFSRHKSVDMLLVYDDARGDFQGEVARLVAKSTRAHKEQ